jgi:hypothetical protein
MFGVFGGRGRRAQSNLGDDGAQAPVADVSHCTPEQARLRTRGHQLPCPARGRRKIGQRSIARQTAILQCINE